LAESEKAEQEKKELADKTEQKKKQLLDETEQKKKELLEETARKKAAVIDHGVAQRIRINSVTKENLGVALGVMNFCEDDITDTQITKIRLKRAGKSVSDTAGATKRVLFQDESDIHPTTKTLVRCCFVFVYYVCFVSFRFVSNPFFFIATGTSQEAGGSTTTSSFWWLVDGRISKEDFGFGRWKTVLRRRRRRRR
jgi:hypothetical protein